MPERNRVGVLLLSQATQPDQTEDLLLRDDIVNYFPAPATTPGQNSTNIADLRSGVRCFHKPIGGVNVQLAKRFGHDPISVGLARLSTRHRRQFPLAMIPRHSSMP